MRFREFIVKPEELDLQEGDSFDIELDNIVLETGILEILEDGVLVEMDAVGMSYLSNFQLDEAEYQGRNVPLGKPMKGDVKKSKVYVKGPSGRVVKVNFGDKKMKIKKSNPKRRKSFRARHNCANPGPRWKARYWSCRAW
jgi:hypothetical protein